MRCISNCHEGSFFYRIGTESCRVDWAVVLKQPTTAGISEFLNGPLNISPDLFYILVNHKYTHWNNGLFPPQINIPEFYVMPLVWLRYLCSELKIYWQHIHSIYAHVNMLFVQAILLVFFCLLLPVSSSWNLSFWSTTLKKILPYQ